ncbi:ABC transporter ATP-binding protein [Lachnospiraceae bacterium ZAX-1]
MKLEIQNVTKQYADKAVLNHFTLEINSGGVFGLIGPNGAGKSTLMKILATLLKPTSGQVLLDGKNIQKNPSEMRKILGYLPQDVSVYPNLTAREFLSYAASLRLLNSKSAKQQIDDLLGIFHIADTGKRRLSEFSGGMRQRVGIACALLGDPQVIVVDEPSVGLDPEERIGLRNLLCDLAKTRILLLSTHIISDIESTAAKLAVIQNGSLIFCGTPQIFTQDTNGDMEAAYLKFIHKAVGV